jgi:hypothetical protein
MKTWPVYKMILFVVCLFLITPFPLMATRMTGNWRLTGYTKYRDAVLCRYLTAHLPHSRHEIDMGQDCAGK